MVDAFSTRVNIEACGSHFKKEGKKPPSCVVHITTYDKTPCTAIIKSNTNIF
jgi:hypothetical protein